MDAATTACNMFEANVLHTAGRQKVKHGHALAMALFTVYSRRERESERESVRERESEMPAT